MPSRRICLSAAIAGGLLYVPGLRAQQAKYPTQPIRLVVPYAAGGGSDYMGRLLAPLMAQRLGQAVFVENRPGGGGTIGASAVTRTYPADGHTVLLSDSNPLVTLTYDPLPDLVPVTLAGKFDFVMVVNPAVLPARNVAEVVAASHALPAGLSYASPGIGTTHHLAMELFARDTGARVIAIPYKGGGPAVQDLLAGQVAMMFLDRASARQYIESGKLRAIGAAGAQRINAFPLLPTIAEQGVKGFEVDGWLGLSVRKGTDSDVIRVLRSAYVSASADADFRKKLDDAGIAPGGTTPEEFAAYRDRYMVKWKKLIADRGMKPE